MKYQQLSPSSRMNCNRNLVIQRFSTIYYLHQPNNSQSKSTQLSDKPFEQSDRALKRLLEGMTTQNPELKIDTWARYFLLVIQQKISHGTLPKDLTIQNQSLEYQAEIGVLHQHLLSLSNQIEVQKFWQNPEQFSKNFLICYLQKSCWYATRNFYYNRVMCSASLRDLLSKEQCLELAFEYGNFPEKLLKNFQVSFPNQVDTYAEKKLENLLKEQLRPLGYDRFVSPWALLRYITRKELLAALGFARVSIDEIKQLRLLWQCFGEIYDTKIHQNGQIKQTQLKPPTEQHLTKISERYNQRRSQFEISSAMQATSVLPMLEQIARLISEYRNASKIEISPGQENLAELEDRTASPWEVLLSVEKSQTIRTLENSVRAILEQPLSVVFWLKCGARLSGIAQTQCWCAGFTYFLFSTNFLIARSATLALFKLYFGLSMTQAEIVVLLGSTLGIQKQYQVFRYLDRAKRSLLRMLTEGLPILHSELLLETNQIQQSVKQINKALEDYLRHHCRQYFYTFLRHSWQKFTLANPLLSKQLLWSQQQPIEFDLSSVRAVLQERIEGTLDIDLSLCQEATNQKLDHLILEWLQDPNLSTQ